MLKIEVYIGINNKLKTHIYSDKEYEEKSLNEEDTYNFIKQFYNLKINDVIDNENFNTLSLSFDNCKLNINEYDRILNDNKFRNLLMPIFLNAKKLYESKKIKELKKRKVSRKNKYKVQKLIAVGIATMLIGSAAVNAFTMHKPNNTDEIPFITQVYSEDDLDNNYIDSDSKDVIEYSPDLQIVNENFEATQISIQYEDKTSSDKAIFATQNYREIIEKYSKIYGLDSNLIMAIATQESGDHYNNINGAAAIGLMQVEKRIWSDEEVTAYNFETNSWEKVTVNLNDLSNLDYNVKIGCMIFQTNLRHSNYNVLAALTEYNMGYGNLHYKILPAYCNENNKDQKEVLNDKNDVGWLDYRYIVNAGDKNYIENVLSYYGDECNIENIRPNGEHERVKISNSLQKMY